MSLLPVITWLLIHLTIWVVCLVFIIPLSLVLWIIIKDLVNNDGKKIKSLIGSLHSQIGNTRGYQSEKEHKKTSIKSTQSVNKNEVLNKTEYVHSKELTEDERKSTSKDNNDEDSVSKTTEEPKTGIIYLDKQTSLTAGFSEKEDTLSKKVE